MMTVLTKQKFMLFSFFLSSFLFSQNCAETNPAQYGDCNTPLGYVWFNSSCVSVLGCDVGDDGELFYNTFEECDIECNLSPSLGDLNNDSQINVIDIVQLINLILNDGDYSTTADLNFDNEVSILDIIILVNIILE